jgi:phosphoglycolate phosphatase-like HAD superfamily hydrolase
MIKAVLFDIDGVLINSFEANLVFYQNLMKAAGYKIPTRDDMQKMFHMTMKDIIKKWISPITDAEVDRVFEMGHDRDIPYPVELLKVQDDYLKVINILEKKYTLGIVTSRIKSGVFESPILGDIKDKFSVVVAFEDTMNHKPDREPMDFALKQLGLKPSEVVYIGDMATDYISAKSAGLHFILFGANNVPAAKSKVAAFIDIPKLIEQIN